MRLTRTEKDQEKIMEVMIKLTEDEQNLLLRHAGYYPDNGPWSSIAGKIKHAREDVWASDGDIPCSVCAALKKSHPLPDYGKRYGLSNHPWQRVFS